MSKVFIEETTLSAIGNAIREKNGSTDLIAPLSMATAIANLSSGGGDLELVQNLNVAYKSDTKHTYDLSTYLSDAATNKFFIILPFTPSGGSTPGILGFYYDGENLTHMDMGAYKLSSSISSQKYENSTLTINFSSRVVSREGTSASYGWLRMLYVK